MKIFPADYKDIALADKIALPFTYFDNFTVPPGSGNFSGHPDFTALRLIFLDIDEVLTSSKTLVTSGYYPHHTTPKDGEINIEVVYPESIDKEAVTLINKLCAATSSMIVLSSSWRIGLNCLQIWSLFESLGLDPMYLLGRTDSEGGANGQGRGEEIQRFMRELTISSITRQRMIHDNYLLAQYGGLGKTEISSYVIIDDSQDMLPEQLPNLVLVNAVEGLSLSDTIYAGRILIKDERFGLTNLCASKPDLFVWQ